MLCSYASCQCPTVLNMGACHMFGRYDRARCEVKYVKDMQLLGAMAPPGGGRNQFSQRISACFSMINMTQPNDAQLRRIFSTLLNSKLAEFADDVRPLGDPIVAASVEIYRGVCRELLPTPSKSHYLFNTRDLAKIVLGVMQVIVHLCVGCPCLPLCFEPYHCCHTCTPRHQYHCAHHSGVVYCVLQASKSFYDNKEDFLQLWVHEAFRIIGDRMWDPSDVAWLRKQLDERLSSAFGTSFASLFEEFNEQVRALVHQILVLLCTVEH